MSRQACVLVADEIYYNLNSKAILQGIFHTDIGIPADPTPAGQLVFFFIIETDITEPFRSLIAEVTLPHSAPLQSTIPVQWPTVPSVETTAGRKTLYTKWPVLVPNPILRPGRIEAKLIHESGEIDVAAPWISLTSIAPPRAN